MTERSGRDERRDLAARTAEITAVARSLTALLHREDALVRDGRYGDLPQIGEEKLSLMRSLDGYAAALQAADWAAALTLPEGAALVESLTRLDEAIRADMRALQRALVATDRVAQVLGAVRSTGGVRAYGPGGEAGAGRGGAVAIDDRV